MLQCRAGYVATDPLLLSFKFVNGVQLMVELYTSIDAVSQVLEKYGDEFCEVVEAKLNLLKLERKKVITANLKSKIDSADDAEAREILFDHLKCNADMANLREYCEVVIAADGYPKMQQLGEKMLSELPAKGLLIQKWPWCMCCLWLGCICKCLYTSELVCLAVTTFASL